MLGIDDGLSPIEFITFRPFKNNGLFFYFTLLTAIRDSEVLERHDQRHVKVPTFKTAFFEFPFRSLFLYFCRILSFFDKGLSGLSVRRLGLSVRRPGLGGLSEYLVLSSSLSSALFTGPFSTSFGVDPFMNLNMFNSFSGKASV